MPFIRVRWFLVLLGAFLISLGVDFYLSQSASASVGAGKPDRLAAADFLGAATAGELSAGTITYRMNAAGLADLSAKRTHLGKTVAVQATARLTDADLGLLRTNHFSEDDAAGVASAKPEGWRGDAATVAHSVMQLLAFLTGIAGALMGVAYVTGRQTSFSSHQMRAATSDVKFSAVAGCDEAKDEVHEVVEFLKDPARFRATGGRMPKGVLLVGPPGTGKTMLAKAVAGEAKAHFYSLSGSDFVELYVGVGAARVRALFKKARETAPSIIFIDEIDAVGRKRSSGETGGVQQEHDQTLNALLVAMDGFDSEDAVVVFGATNRPDTMDTALLRPGRFDRQVSVGLPDLAGRTAILQVHAGSVKLDDSVDLKQLAKGTPGFSGADLANLLNEGAIHAARHRRATVTMADLDEARDKINWGRECPRAFTENDKRIIAYHEAGHALVQVLSGDDTMKLHKVTIIPRGRSLGSTQFTPERDVYNQSREQLVNRLRCLMAGRVAEEIALGSITSGASSDIQEATRIARQMVFEWGMSPLGFMALTQSEGEAKLASPQTLHDAEHYVKTILEENYGATTQMVAGARAALDAIARDLIEHETISGDHVRQTIGAMVRAA
ncbi:MAG TPA: ATP-dependent zinc metalloprotease FtsH [Lacunisphaera sp.]|jgi:cell division protease FtsH